MNYDNMLFNDSSNKSFLLSGKLIDILLSGDDCSESNVSELFFIVFVCNENDVVSCENDSAAFLF